jgi:hypothetical protein
MLIEHDRVSIWIHENHVSWTGTGGIRFRRNGKARSFEPTLQISHVREIGQCLFLMIPPRIKGHDVGWKHALEQTNRCSPVLHDEPIFGLDAISMDETQLFIERTGGGDVLVGGTAPVILYSCPAGSR